MRANEKYLPSKEQVLGTLLFIILFVFQWQVFQFVLHLALTLLPISGGFYIFLSWLLFLINFPLSVLSTRYISQWIKES